MKRDKKSTQHDNELMKRLVDGVKKEKKEEEKKKKRKKRE